mmetsp:Transcript_86154/g.271699  ORF Transcript_86154/g.271699 Transcript_86154/m.271699 type:complete len:227 (-) Transcript_86154:1257-1937(-)
MVAATARASCTRTRQPPWRSNSRAASSAMPRRRGRSGPASSAGSRLVASTAARRPSSTSSRGRRRPANGPAGAGSSGPSVSPALSRAANAAAAACASADAGAATPRRSAAARTSRTRTRPGRTARSSLSEYRITPEGAPPDCSVPWTTSSPEQPPSASGQDAGAPCTAMPPAPAGGGPSRRSSAGLAERCTDRCTAGTPGPAGSAATPKAAQNFSPAPTQSGAKSK